MSKIINKLCYLMYFVFLGVAAFVAYWYFVPAGLKDASSPVPSAASPENRHLLGPSVEDLIRAMDDRPDAVERTVETY
jgi:hypothetical protein